ncbi:MAG: DNA polymerase I [Candidatus Omnitrophica bacterium]|nr:DNA polymerase I [Candidatus Omnitrophota bacterium]
MDSSLVLKEPSVYLVDATAFCYRAFYALKGLTTSYGQPTNAVYGFTNMLNKLLKENSPSYLAVCFDVSRKTFRQEKYSEYKITRPPMPEGLISQLPFIREIVDAYQLCRFEIEGFEADDIIATLVERLKNKDLSVVIVSSDKDVLQLIEEKVIVFNPYKDRGIFYSKEKVLKQYGVMPERIIDILALMGDDTDNILGVPGIGEKTAYRLIKEFKNLSNLIDNINRIEPVSIRESIKKNLKIIELNRQLLELNRKVPIKFNLDDLRVKEPNYLKLYTIFNKLEFRSFLKDLPIKDNINLFKIEGVVNVALKDLIDSIGDELVVIGDYDNSKILLYTKSKKFSWVTLSEAKAILEDNRIKKIGYDLKTLAHFLNLEGVKINNLYFDIMVASYLLEPSEQDYSLESIVFRYFSIILKQPNKEIFAELVLRLYLLFKEELTKRSLDELFYSMEMPLIEVLIEMEENGIKFDKDILKELSCKVELTLKDIKEQIFLNSGEEFNLNSPKQLRRILFEKLNLPVIKRTRSGPSTDEEVLRVLADRHKLASLILDYRQLIKLKSTYLEPLISKIDSRTHKIHAHFSQISTETGRLSCSHPNLQNLPIKSEIARAVRKAVIPDSLDENWLVCADYSQIELRILAHLSEDPLLVKSFQEDRDIHKFTASLLYGIKQEEVTEQMRDTAKRVNFGIIYGLSAYGLSKDLRISQEEAESFIEAYFLRYPKVKEFIKRQIEKTKEDGFVTTIFGRRRYLPHIHSSQQHLCNLAHRQAINTVIQGTAADLIKLAMISISQAIKRHKLFAKMLLQIHDELLFDINEKDLEQCIALIKDKMENIYKFIVPIKTVIKKGKNWLQMQEVDNL